MVTNCTVVSLVFLSSVFSFFFFCLSFSHKGNKTSAATGSLAADLINTDPPACLYSRLSITALITRSRIDGKWEGTHCNTLGNSAGQVCST